jgi:hypothetical protein
MAKRPRGRKPPKVILSPDLADDDDVPVMATPDEDGWVYLKRSRKPKEESRGKEARGRRKR